MSFSNMFQYMCTIFRESTKKPNATAKHLFIGSLVCSIFVVDTGYMKKVKLYLF